VQARGLAGDDEPLRRVSPGGAQRGDASAAALAACLLPLPAVPGTPPTAVAGAHRAGEVPLRGNDSSKGRAQPCRGVGGGPTAAARCARAPEMVRWEGREWRGESPPCWWHGWGGRLPAGLAERTQMTKAAVRRGGRGGLVNAEGRRRCCFTTAAHVHEVYGAAVAPFLWREPCPTFSGSTRSEAVRCASRFL